MEYILGQKHYGAQDSGNFMTLVYPNAQAITVDYWAFKNQTTLGEDEGKTITFEEQCLFLGNNNYLTVDTPYYFHGKIKMLEKATQTIDVRLVNVTNVSNKKGQVSKSPIQFIKSFDIPYGTNSWYDIEFVFKPLSTTATVGFNGILFQCRRDALDFDDDTRRKPVLMYEEISEINNIVSELGVPKGGEIVKLGVQSRPSMLMCINGEEIRSSKTGIYEVRNGKVTVNSFSVISSAEEDPPEEQPNVMANTMLGNPSANEIQVYDYSVVKKDSNEYKKYALTSDTVTNTQKLINKEYRSITMEPVNTGASTRPRESGYYEIIDDYYIQTEDEYVQHDKTYYRLIKEVIYTEFSPTESASFTNKEIYPKKRTISGFTLDYMIAKPSNETS